MVDGDYQPVTDTAAPRNGAGAESPPASGDAAGRRAASSRTIEGICQVFWELERRYDLLGWQVNGVHPWPLVRMQIYYGLTQKAGLFAPAHPTLKQQFREIGRRVRLAEWAAGKVRIDDWVPRLPLPAWTGYRLVGVKRKRCAILMATRRIDGSEPYTDALRAELGSDALLIDRPHLDGTLPGAYDLERLKLRYAVRYGRSHRASRLADRDRAFCNDLRADFTRSIGADPGDIAERIESAIRRFRYVRIGAERLFRQHGVETLFLTNAYGAINQAFVAAAHDAGGRVIELQHGFISRFHLGYSWPDRPDVPYTPDGIWCFGDFWAETTPLPGGMAARTIGAPYVRGRVKQAAGQRREDLVVFASQGVVGDKLFDFGVDTARRRPDRDFVFRLHPSESLEAYEKRLARVADKPANFNLSHRTPNIFTLLSGAGIQVGAFSTTLFEGMALGTRTVVVDLPGAEYMRPAIERGDAIFVRSSDELAARLDEAPLAARPQHYYAEPVSPLL